MLHEISEIFLPMFSSRTFMVLWLIFKSFIYVEFIFVYGVGWWSSFIFLHVAVQTSKHYFLIGLFVFLEWSHVNSMYFGDQTLVWGNICKYIFPYFWFLFQFLMFSLSVQKLFILMRSHFFILSFMSLALGDILVKILLCGYLKFSCICSSIGLLWCHDLYLSVLPTLNLFLCIV